MSTSNDRGSRSDPLNKYAAVLAEGPGPRLHCLVDPLEDGLEVGPPQNPRHLPVDVRLIELHAPGVKGLDAAAWDPQKVSWAFAMYSLSSSCRPE